MQQAEIDEILKKIKKMLMKFLKIKEDSIMMTSLLRDDLGADSVEIMELIAKVEEEFEIEIEEQDAKNLDSIESVVTMISNKMKQKS